MTNRQKLRGVAKHVLKSMIEDIDESKRDADTDKLIAYCAGIDVKLDAMSEAEVRIHLEFFKDLMMEMGNLLKVKVTKKRA